MTTSFSTSFTMQPSAIILNPLDSAIVSETESGYVIARKRFTRQRLKIDVSYHLMDETDYEFVKELWDAVGTWDLVSWTFDGETYTCRFAEPGLTVRMIPPKLYDVSFSFLTI